MTAFFFCSRVFSNLFATHTAHTALFRTMRFLLPLLLLLAIAGCTPQLSLLPPMTGSSVSTGAPKMEARPSGLRVRTHDDGTLLFHGDDWRLTPTGIRGKADVSTAEGTTYTTDTTLSYWDAAEAGPAGRQSTMGQFMLTILGVILVLGLAAIILYAAFLATDR